jgi:hypothetical protein
MELNEFLTRLSRNSNPSDYLSRQGFGSRMTRTSGSSLLRDQGYGAQIAVPSYGSIPNAPAGPSASMPTVTAGVRPNFNRAWGGDMDFPTLGAIANQAMAMGTRAQKRASARSGGYSGRGRGQSGAPQGGGGSPQGTAPQGGGLMGIPYNAPSPMRTPRTPTSPSRKQKRQDAALLGRLQTAYPDDFSAGADLFTVSTISKEEGQARRYAGLDASLAEKFDVTPGGNIVPKQPTQVIGPEQSPPPVRTTAGAGFQPTDEQLAQADKDKDALSKRSEETTGSMSYEDLASRKIDPSEMSTKLEKGETYEQKKARLEANLRKNQKPNQIPSTTFDRGEVRTGFKDVTPPPTPVRKQPAWMENAETRSPEAPPPGAPDLSWRQQQQQPQQPQPRSSRRRPAGPNPRAIGQVRADLQQASQEAQARNAQNM